MATSCRFLVLALAILAAVAVAVLAATRASAGPPCVNLGASDMACGKPASILNPPCELCGGEQKMNASYSCYSVNADQPLLDQFQTSLKFQDCSTTATTQYFYIPDCSPEECLGGQAHIGSRTNGRWKADVKTKTVSYTCECPADDSRCASRDAYDPLFGPLNISTSTCKIPSINNLWASSYPQFSQIKLAHTRGANIFRVPFRIEYVHELTSGWALTTNDQIAQPREKYFTYVMHLVEKIRSLGTASRPVTVILDLHNYQRWCPAGIGGEFSCLSPTNPDAPVGARAPNRQYSMEGNPCPFKFDDDGSWPKTLGSAPISEGLSSDLTSRTLSSNCNKVFTKFKEGVSPTDSRENGICSGCPQKPGDPSCSEDNACYGSETARILDKNCVQIMWFNLLNVPFILPGSTQQTTLKEYLNRNITIFVGLMNEPHELDNRELAKATAAAFMVVRTLCPATTILAMGNYWGGLHAQITPVGATSPSNSRCARPDASSQGWFKTPQDAQKAPCNILYEELTNAMEDANLKTLQPWYYEVHQYLDKNSTGNNGCAGDFDSHCTGSREIDFLTGFTEFSTWCSSKGIKMIVTEVGGQVGDGLDCLAPLTTFLQLLYDNPDTVAGYTLWRQCPNVSWFYPGGNLAEAWANCLIFAPTVEEDGTALLEAFTQNNKGNVFWGQLQAHNEPLAKRMKKLWNTNLDKKDTKGGVFWQGVNVTGMDYGTLTNQVGFPPSGTCSDMTPGRGDSGGWLKGIPCTKCCPSEVAKKQIANAFALRGNYGTPKFK